MDGWRTSRWQTGSVNGHTLVWHKSCPRAAPLLLERRPEGRALLPGRTSVGHAIAQWDVSTADETGYRMDGETVLPASVGADYIARALWEARQLAPQAKLMINVRPDMIALERSTLPFPQPSGSNRPASSTESACKRIWTSQGAFRDVLGRFSKRS
jgi:hypothetical protein